MAVLVKLVNGSNISVPSAEDADVTIDDLHNLFVNGSETSLIVRRDHWVYVAGGKSE